jgi:hypothetical protein
MPRMRKFRYQIGPIVKGSSYTLDMPLRSHAQHRARGCISMSDPGDVNIHNRDGEVD